MSARLPWPALPGEAERESAASPSSRCSYSSTTVHVGDRKPPPEPGTRAVLGGGGSGRTLTVEIRGVATRPRILSKRI